MKEVEKASFSFDSYKILKFSYVDPLEDIDTISFKIFPSGEYLPKTGIFNSKFEFVVKYGTNNEHELLTTTMFAKIKYGKHSSS